MDSMTKCRIKEISQYMMESLDLFGQIPQLRISNKNKYNSKLGFLFTCVLISLVAIYATYSIMDLSLQSDPSIISSQYQFTDSSPFPLQRNNYTFTMSVVDSNIDHTIILNKHVVIKAEQCYRNRVINDITGEVQTEQSCDDYPLEACTMDHFITEIQIEHFEKSSLGTQQCFQMKKWDTDPPIIQSYLQGMEYKYLQITLEECKNTTESSNCAPTEEIKEKLATGYYVIHQSDYLLNMESPKKPFEEIISVQSTTFSITSSKTFYSQVQLQTAKTDVGIIQKEYTEESKIPLYLMRETQESYNQKYLVKHILQFDNKATIYKRNYIKLQTILGSTGGLYSVLYLLMQFLLKKILQVKMNVEMANLLFHFESENNKPRSKKSIQQSLGIEVKDSSQLINFLQKKNSSLLVSIKAIFFAVLNIKSPMIKQLEYAQNKYQSKLDVLNIVNKMHEIDKLKYILLTEEQQNLFNYLPKPTIPYQNTSKAITKSISNLEQQKAYKMILQDQQSDLSKLQQAFSAYYNIQLKKSKTRIEEQLIAYLDQEIIELFDELIMDNLKLEQIFPDLNSQINSSKRQSNRISFQEDQIIEVELKSSDLSISVPRFKKN